MLKQFHSSDENEAGSEADSSLHRLSIARFVALSITCCQLYYTLNMTQHLNVTGENVMESEIEYELNHEWLLRQPEFRFLDRAFVERNTRFFIWTR